MQEKVAVVLSAEAVIVKLPLHSLQLCGGEGGGVREGGGGVRGEGGGVRGGGGGVRKIRLVAAVGHPTECWKCVVERGGMQDN